jgi:hypothetical protein
MRAVMPQGSKVRDPEKLDLHITLCEKELKEMKEWSRDGKELGRETRCPIGAPLCVCFPPGRLRAFFSTCRHS